MRPAGLEPAAYWFEASRSIQLSYGRVNWHHNVSIIDSAYFIKISTKGSHFTMGKYLSFINFYLNRRDRLFSFEQFYNKTPYHSEKKE